MLKRPFVGLASILIAALPVFAQSYEMPPARKYTGDQSLMVEWLIGAVFLVGTLAVAFKPAKRSNLK